jgi:hypothetical protein
LPPEPIKHGKRASEAMGPLKNLVVCPKITIFADVLKIEAEGLLFLLSGQYAKRRI